MKRMTTDNPKGNLETMLNLIFPKEGWSHIRNGAEGKAVTDFILSICRDRKCEYVDDEIMAASNERKDEMLCDCAFEPCPIADVYAAFCGFAHTRDRLELYENACFDDDGNEIITMEELEALRKTRVQVKKEKAADGNE